MSGTSLLLTLREGLANPAPCHHPSWRVALYLPNILAYLRIALAFIALGHATNYHHRWVDLLRQPHDSDMKDLLEEETGARQHT